MPFHHAPLPPTSALLSGREPPDELGFRSTHLQIWYNQSEQGWADPAPHAHLESDECFIVLRGALIVEVAGERLRVGPGEFCCFPRGLFHAVVGVETPIESLMIRAPSVADKIYAEPGG